MISLCRFSTVSFKNKVGIVGVPFDKGQRINSSNSKNFGPKAIRDGGLISEIRLFNGTKIDIVHNRL